MATHVPARNTLFKGNSDSSEDWSDKSPLIKRSVSVITKTYDKTWTKKIISAVVFTLHMEVKAHRRELEKDRVMESKMTRRRGHKHLPKFITVMVEIYLFFSFSVFLLLV